MPGILTIMLFGMQISGKEKCPLVQETNKVVEGKQSYNNFLLFVFHVLYKTGIIGLKLDSYEKTIWCWEFYMYSN